MQNVPFPSKPIQDLLLCECEKEGKLRFSTYEPLGAEDVVYNLEEKARKIKAERAVIDPISWLGIMIMRKEEFRETIVKLSRSLRKLGCTSPLLSEIPSELPQALSRFGVEEFISDGVIQLHYSRTNTTYHRAISIRKMRGTHHDRKIRPFKISSKGIIVYPEQEELVGI